MLLMIPRTLLRRRKWERYPDVKRWEEHENETRKSTSFFSPLLGSELNPWFNCSCSFFSFYSSSSCLVVSSPSVCNSRLPLSSHPYPSGMKWNNIQKRQYQILSKRYQSKGNIIRAKEIFSCLRATVIHSQLNGHHIDRNITLLGIGERWRVVKRCLPFWCQKCKNSAWWNASSQKCW